MNASASLPSSHQVDDGSDGHQHHIAQAKANVAAKVLSPGITDASTCNSPAPRLKHYRTPACTRSGGSAAGKQLKMFKCSVLAKSP